MTVWEFMKQMPWYDKWRIVIGEREVTTEPIGTREVEANYDGEIPQGAIDALEKVAARVDLVEKIIYSER